MPKLELPKKNINIFELVLTMPFTPSIYRISLICAFALLSSSVYSEDTTEEGFIENKGQIFNQDYKSNEDVLFLYAGKGIKIQLRKSGYSYELFKIKNAPQPLAGTCPFETSTHQSPSIESYRVDVDFLGMTTPTEIIKENKSTGCLNYFVCGKEAAQVFSYGKVIYKNVFKNTDIEFIIQENVSNSLKYNLVLHPGARIEDLQFLIKGADQVMWRRDSLLVSTPFGRLAEIIPKSYYTDSPDKEASVHFKLDKNRVSFSGQVNPARTLVIDPACNLIWSTYYGGTTLDYCTSTSVDAQNNVYLSGHSMSTTNIATSGSYQSVLNGSLDAYLAKFDPNGTRLWATYFGGSSYDQLFSMYVEPTGAIYLSGDTNSPSNIASPGAYQTSYGGGIDDVLLVKFDLNGLLLWATYYGGTEHDITQALMMDKDGNIVIAGHTQSTGVMASQGAYNPYYLGIEDVFIAKFNPNGYRVWGTYYGDTDIEEAYGLAGDPSGNIYVTGMTQSIANISNASGYQVNPGGLKDGFLAKFNSAGNNLIWGSYYGGNSDDKGTVVRVSNLGDVILCGNTTSPNNMASPNAYQTALGSADDSFFAAFSQTGGRLWGSYFGGNNVDYIEGMVLDTNSNIVFCGETISTNAISTSGAYQSTISTLNDYDAYFVKFSPDGTVKKLGTYFGGPVNDYGHAIAVDHTGKVYLAGETTSTVGIATPGSNQPAQDGAQDAFLAKFCIPIEPWLSSAGGATVCMGPGKVTAESSYATYLWSDLSTVNPMVITYSVQGTYYYSVFVTDGFGCSGYSDTLQVIVEGCYVSLPEYTAGDVVSLFPVPSNDFLTLTTAAGAGPVEIQIYSSAGQMVLNSTLLTQPFKVDINAFPSGLYLLKAKMEGHTLEKKFIKQ